MQVLVIGSGGREHALCWKIAQSDRIDKLYAAPGSGAISRFAECIDIKADEIALLADFAKEKKIDLTVVGPEAPLAAGIVDLFKAEGLRIFGPDKYIAQLEGSKVFAKEVMARFNIPTAAFKVFDDASKAKEYIKKKDAPIVIKADGLAAGKGVIIAGSKDEASSAIDRIMVSKEFGSSGDKVIIEDCLLGEEASIILVSDGEDYNIFASSQDHKRVFDNDQGPNCYSEDTEILTNNGWKRFDILKPNDNVAVFEQKSRKFYFEKPIKRYWKKYKGPMALFKNRNIDLLVTPNHKMLLQQRRGKEKVFIKEARDYKGENYIYQSGVWVGKRKNFFILPEYSYGFNRKFKKLKIDLANWAQFLGVYLSEGYTTKGKGSKRVYIAQTSKSKNFKKIKKIINKSPFKFSFEQKNHKFRINSTQLALYLNEFGTSHKKYVPEYLKNANSKIIMEFLKAFNLGDGDVHRGKMRFCSSSKRLIDDIQEMIIKLDCTGIITIDKRKTMISPLNKKRYKASPVYSIEMKKRNKTSIRKYNTRKVNYDGYVGCVTVPTGFVVVRRNNRVAISGNTGGMGAYSPAPIITDAMQKRIEERIIKPLIKGLSEEGTPCTGVVYIGIMIVSGEPYVLEFNMRFGDPEAQAILPRLKTDLLDIMEASIDNKIKDLNVEWDKKACVCVVCASGGYPGAYKKGMPIYGLEDASNIEDVFVFHAGTKLATCPPSPLDTQATVGLRRAGDMRHIPRGARDPSPRDPEQSRRATYETNGGRVLGVTALGEDIAKAIDKVYDACSGIKFENMHYRKDIGCRAVKKYKNVT
ncbi:MAG: phosphoribosylglycinamide synthetase C domain-containing protein [Candidatus Omnitrophota bacterium]